MSTRTSRGRRPGAPDTRAEVLDAARASFAEKGFRATTIRAVAASAGVDPALVHHYFGTKDNLFLAALEMPVDPRELLAPVVQLGPDGAGERLLRTFLSVWDDPEIQVRLLAVVRSVLDDDGGQLLKEGFIPVVVGPVLAQLVDGPAGGPDPAGGQPGGRPDRGPLRPGPAADGADARRRTSSRASGPVLQHYLTGDLGAGVVQPASPVRESAVLPMRTRAAAQQGGRHVTHRRRTYAPPRARELLHRGRGGGGSRGLRRRPADHRPRPHHGRQRPRPRRPHPPSASRASGPRAYAFPRRRCARSPWR